MPRKPRIQRKTKPRLTEQIRHFLEFGEFQKGPDNVLVFNLAGRHPGDEEQLRQIWNEHKDTIMRDWRQEYPCSRPWAWWRLESPEPRQQVSGSGLAVEADCEFGVPRFWMNTSPADLPKIESQSAYLSRLGLLTAVEKHYLSDHPEMLEPILLGED